MLKQVKCAIYTRKSCEEGLEQAFNSLDAQRLAGESYITSQQHEGWIVVDKKYDDGGYSGGTLERPALQELFADVEKGEVDCIVVYKIDRLSRSLLDFAKIVDLFDKHKVTFVSVTQSFNTSNSMGRLMLNVVLSFAQYERELTGERIRDKFAASKQKGIWMGGRIPLGYDIKDKKLVINEEEAKVVKYIFSQFISLKSVITVTRELEKLGHCTKRYQSKLGCAHGGLPFKKATVHSILTNPIYNGYISYKGKLYPGQHKAIIFCVKEALNRVLRDRLKKLPIINNWKKLIEYLKVSIGNSGMENVRIIYLNKKYHLIAEEVQDIGTIDQTPLYIREVIKKALLKGATSIIVSHNHPSGDPKPSESDIAMTKRLALACNTLSIELVDHVIITRDDHFSFYENGLL